MNIELETTVWSRAHDRCEYCLIPQQADVLPFEIDHIIARKHGGKTVLENLALACIQCNSYKGPNIATIDPDTGELTRLFHPRDDRWQDHFELMPDGRILGRTAPGRGTIRVLSMNEFGAVELRRLLILDGKIDASYHP